jgi:quercetin dioxygenase-like cupin family protein
MPTATNVVHHRWSDVPAEQINPAISRRFISAERVTVARFELARGGVVPAHAHENEQVTFVVSGALQFALDSQTVVVRAGEVLQIPPNVRHEVEVLEDALVIDVFSPVRQDWIDGTDGYFARR